MLIIYPPEFKINNMLDVDFNRKVMRRVRFVYYVRKITHPLFVEGFILSFFVLLSANYVSFKNVISNSLSVSNLPSVGTFWLNAFQKTDLPLGIMVVIFGISTIFFYQIVVTNNFVFYRKISRLFVNSYTIVKLHTWHKA